MKSRVAPSSVVACCAGILAACGGPSATTVATVAVAPMCAIFAVTYDVNPNADTVSVMDRTDPNVPHGFTLARRISGPLGNSAIGFRADVYGISEAWERTPTGPVVVRAQEHDAKRPASMDFQGSAWSLRAQDSRITPPATTVGWSPVFATGTSNPGNDVDTPQGAAIWTPQLMRVGDATQQIFACAGGRSEDNAVRTTLLFEVKPPTGSPLSGGGVVFIQDLLNGDDRFVPNAPGPLVGPATPPTPTITNRPGNPVREGSVHCAMTQLGDDVTTRELHMLTISNGVLYHSLASNFSTATTGSGVPFERFNDVTSWGDVGQVLGGGFGGIVGAAITPSRASGQVSVFFVAESGGRYRLYHTVRYPSGAWRPADDVLAMNGGTLNGTNFPFFVAAGRCPVLGSPQDSEVVYAIWDDDRQINFGRVVSTPQQWAPGISGIYPPMNNLSGVFPTSSDTSRQNGMKLVIAERPFSDNASS
jgi:hypothetical protein